MSAKVSLRHPGGRGLTAVGVGPNLQYTLLMRSKVKLPAYKWVTLTNTTLGILMAIINPGSSPTAPPATAPHDHGRVSSPTASS